MTNNDPSLVVQERDTQPEAEPLSETLGGYQALIMLVIVAVLIFLVFALPTPGNPVAPSPAGDAAGGAAVTAPQPANLIDTLAELTVEPPAESE